MLLTEVEDFIVSPKILSVAFQIFNHFTTDFCTHITNEAIAALVSMSFVCSSNMAKQVQLSRGSVFICFHCFLKDYIVDLQQAHLTLL